MSLFGTGGGALDSITPAQRSVTLDPGAATGGTLTLPLVAGMFHYIIRIRAARSSTAALVGSATLQITTTNLPGNPFWRVGNAMVIGGTQVDIDENFTSPVQSAAVGVNTTFVFPSAGAAVLWTATVWYYVGA